MSAWFRYERRFGRWCPVVYHEGKPGVPKGEEEMFTAAVHVPADCINARGEPMFGRLQAKFPPPKSAV
ncbi:hypothetical protein HNQ96_006209 [Aminobacter lissarensis]|uniref:Uncharacterized protein n=1 Tax=Aminobacter carboxidus TaxID=376165 RepID=A0A8E1WKM0_9HYPH|nr:hypothetical protein [Aminobacter lissarensis]